MTKEEKYTTAVLIGLTIWNAALTVAYLAG